MATAPENAHLGFTGRSSPMRSRWGPGRGSQRQGLRPPFSTPRNDNSPLNPLSPVYHPRQLGAQDSGSQRNPATPPSAPAYALHDQYAREYPPLRHAFEGLENSSSPLHQAQPSAGHGFDPPAFPRHQAQFPEQYGLDPPPFLRHQAEPLQPHGFDSPPFPSHRAQNFEDYGFHAPPLAQQQFPLLSDFGPFHGSLAAFQAHAPSQGSVDDHDPTPLRATVLPHPTSFPPDVPPPFGFDRFTSPSLGVQALDSPDFGHCKPPGVSQGRPDVGFHPDIRPVSRPFSQLTIPPPGLGFEGQVRNPDSYNPRILPISEAPQAQIRVSSPPFNPPTEPRALRLLRDSLPADSQSPRPARLRGADNRPIPYPLASYGASVRLRSGAAPERELLRTRREGYKRLLESVETDPLPVQNAITFSRSGEDQSANTATRLEGIVHEIEKLNPEVWTTAYDDPVPDRYQPDFDFYPTAIAPGFSMSRHCFLDFVPTTPCVAAVLHHIPKAQTPTEAPIIRSRQRTRRSRGWRKKTPAAHSQSQSHSHPQRHISLEHRGTLSMDQGSPASTTTPALLHEARLKTTAIIASGLLARGKVEILRQDRCESGVPIVTAFLASRYPALSPKLCAAFNAERNYVSLLSSRYLRYIRDVVLKESDVIIQSVQTSTELTWRLVGWEEAIERAAEKHWEGLEERKGALMGTVKVLGMEGGNDGEMEMAMNVAVFGGVERQDLPPYLAVFA